MTTKELYLKTVFSCIACDGDIAKEEVELLQNIVSEDKMFHEVDVKTLLDKWISEINEDGTKFLNSYLEELANSKLSEQEQLMVVDLAIKAIEADNRIEYSEVKFFKKIRSRLSIPDEAILKEHPDKDDFLLPDLNVAAAPVWDDHVKFNNIVINTLGK